MRQSHLLLTILLFFSISAAAGTIDSLQHILATSKHLDLFDKVIIYSKLGDEYKQSEEYDKAIAEYKKGIKHAEEINDRNSIAVYLSNIGECQERRNNYQEAIENFKAVIDMDLNNAENPVKINAYTQLASIYQALGDYELAYENQMQALSVCDEVGQTALKGRVLYNIGSIFYYQKQYERALEYYEKSKKISDNIKNKRADYACYAALGSVHEKLKNHNQSLAYNELSLQLAEKLNYKTGIAYALGNIATNYRMLGKLEEAERMMKKSIQLKLEIGDRWAMIGGKIDLSQLYLQWHKPEHAIPLLYEAIDLSRKLDSKGRLPDIYQTMAFSYEQLNEPVNELKYIKKYIALKDSLINEKTVEEMGQSKQRYELREKEHQITLLKKRKELLEKNNEIRQQQLYIFAIAIVAFLMFLWWYKSKLDYQNKVNKLLGEKNSLLADKNEEIHIKNKQLENSNEDLQQFAYVASHDLKEPLRMINSYTNLLHRRYNDLFDESGKEFMHYVVDAVKRMETLLDDLLDFSRAGTQPPPTTFISLKDIMVIVEANLRHRLQTLNATLIVKNEHLPKVKAHRTMLIQLLQNLVSNGVKFKGDRDPKVIVDCIKEETQYIVSVSDNGIGISKENLEKVFEMFRRLHTRDEYEGTGIGLATCKRIVTTWGGDIWVESTEGVGSTFFFSFPISVAEMETVKA